MTLKKFIAIGLNCFGTGLDVSSAVANAARYWPSHVANPKRKGTFIRKPTLEHFSVYEVVVTDEAHWDEVIITDWGAIQYPKGKGATCTLISKSIFAS